MAFPSAVVIGTPDQRRARPLAIAWYGASSQGIRRDAADPPPAHVFGGELPGGPLSQLRLMNASRNINQKKCHGQL
jgi:hypothetical protein